MNYLIIKDNTIVQICISIEKLFEYLEINITDNGIVKIGNNNQLPTSYSMSHFTKEEIIKDVQLYHLKKIEAILQIGIYYLRRVQKSK